MPALGEFSLIRLEDGILQIGMAPPVAIGGWSVEFTVVKRLGGTDPYITKSMASGYYGVSGMLLTNSGQGVMRVNIDSVDTSGMDAGLYVYNVARLSSGSRTVLSRGHFVLNAGG